MITVTLDAGSLGDSVQRRLSRWADEDIAARLWNRDHTIWFPEPVAELTNRLGWLDLPHTMARWVGSWRSIAAEIAAEGIEHVLLLGMGGSSLAPEVFARIFGRRASFPALTVVDTTHPDAIAALDERIDPARTFFLVSSKSGSTLETLSLFRHFWALCEGLGTRGRHFAAVTDPGSPLQTLAADRGFRRVFLAPPDVGGRFSALSPFGLVPAALIGLDPSLLLGSAAREAASARNLDSAAFLLAALLGSAARAGRDKLTFITSPSLEPFTAWIEQLVAESTGKGGRGILPVCGEPLQTPDAYGEDRVFVQLVLEGERDLDLDGALERVRTAGHPMLRMVLESVEDLGGAIFMWEAAVALAGALLGIHPFDQPDVQLAKELAAKAMAGGVTGHRPEAVRPGDPAAPGVLRDWLALGRPGSYVAIQAFLAPDQPAGQALNQLRRLLIEAAHLPTTLGYGPRFLHSTGQLHKGGPDTGLFLQLVDSPIHDLPIPETGHTFGRLIAAQADGDFAALDSRGRHVLRVDLGRETGALADIAASLVLVEPDGDR